MSSKKRKSSCPFESSKITFKQLIFSTQKERETNLSQGSSKKAPPRKKSGKKVSKLGCCVSEKGSYFEQEKLLAKDEENVSHFLSTTSLAHSPFEAVTVINIST